MIDFASGVRRTTILMLCLLFSAQSIQPEVSLKEFSVEILAALKLDMPTVPMLDDARDEHEATLAVALLAQKLLHEIDLSDNSLGNAQEIALLQETLVQEIQQFAAEHHLEKELSSLQITKKPTTRQVSNTQDMQVGGNLANWGTTTIETGLVINNNNGGTVAAPAFQLSSFTSNQALLVTTTAGLNILQISTDVTQPALSIANSSGVFASTTSGARILVNGAVSSTGGSTITSGTLVISAGNIILPTANAAGTQGLLELGGSSTASNVELYEFGTRNFFAGNYTTPNTSVTGADNISIGTNANSTLTSNNNTIALGSASSTFAGAVAGGNSSIAIGSADSVTTTTVGAIANGNDAIAIGVGSITAANNTIALGLMATATVNTNAIAIGSANPSLSLAGPSAAGMASVALGGADGSGVAGAKATAARSVAIGAGSLATQADSIILGNPNNVSVAVAIGTSSPATTFTTTARLTIVTSGNQNAIAASNGSISAPAYSFVSTNTSVGMYSPGQNQLALVSSNTTRLLIDSTGSVSCFSKYKAHAYRNSTQSITNTTATVVFNTITFDPNNNFSTGTGLYTAPLSGYYWVGVSVGSITNSNNSNKTIDLIKNGSVITGYSSTGGTSNNGVQLSLAVHELVQLNQGDTLGVQYTTGGNDTIQINTTHFDIHYMSTV